jgi:hypothetical protein
MPTITSLFGRLNLADFAKGAIVSVLSTVLPIILDTLKAGSLTFNWKTIATVAIAAFIGYILKQLGTAPSIKIPVDSTTAKLFKAGKLDAKVFDPKAEKNA